MVHCEVLQARLAIAWDRLTAGMKKKWDQLTPSEEVRILKELIHLERLVLSQPIEADAVRHRIETTPSEDIKTTATEVDGALFKANPKVLAPTVAILVQFENKPEPISEVDVESDSA
jgi:hypothetical protein